MSTTIYLDNSATTPLCPEAMTAMQLVGGVLILGFTLWNELAPRKQ